MNTLAQNTDTQVNQAECKNISPESQKALAKKGIFLKTCQELARHVRAVTLGVTLAAATPAVAFADDAKDTNGVSTAPVATEVAPNAETKKDFSVASRAFMELLVKNGDITPEILEKVMTSETFEYNPGKDETLMPREKLALPDANLPLHFAELLKELGKDPVSAKKWEERLTEMSPNEDELQILRKVIASMPDDKLHPTVIANTLIGIMTLHKYVQAPDDKYLVLNMYDDIHKVLYGLGWDVSNHVMVPVNNGDLSYTFLLPTTAQHIVFIGEKAGFDPNKLQAFHKALVPGQQEFITKAKEIGGKPVETAIAKMETAEARALQIKKTKGYDMPEYNLITQWMLAVEQGKIGLEKAQAFRDEYQKLSPEDQKAFVSTVDTKTHLSSGTTPAHVAFNGLKEDQRSQFDILVKGTIKEDMQVVRLISSVYASVEENEKVIYGLEDTPAKISKFQPLVSGLGVSTDAYIVDAFTLGDRAEKYASLTPDQKKDIIAQWERANAKLDAENAKLDAENAKLDAENAKLDAENAKLDAEIVQTRKETAEILAKNVTKVD